MTKLRFATVLVLFAMVLAACSSGNNQQENGTAYPGLGTETTGRVTQQVPVTGAETATKVATTAATKVATTTVATKVATSVAGGVSSTATSSVVNNGVGLNDTYPNLFSELADYRVVDSSCAEIGSVAGFVVNAKSGQFVYVVVDPTNSLNLEGRLLIPYEALQLNLTASANSTSTTTAGTMVGTQTPVVGSTATVSGQTGACDLYVNNQAFMLTKVTASQFSGFPVIKSDQDLNTLFGTQGWDTQIRAFWTKLGVKVSEVTGSVAGNTTGMTTGQAVGTATATVLGTQAAGSMVGQEVVEVFIAKPGDIQVLGSNNKEIANVQDMIVEPKTGKITHVILSVGGFLGIGDSLVPVPWGSFKAQWNDNNKLTLVINADENQLKNAPSFKSLSEFPSTQSQGWDSEFNSYWKVGSGS